MNRKLLVLISICVVSAAIGCSKQNEAQTNNYSTQSVKKNTEQGNVKINSTNNSNMNMKEDKLVKKIEGIKGVKKATIYNDGHHILVGLDLNDQKQMKQVHNEVYNHIVTEHPNHKIHVTSDPQLHSRIQKLKPLDGHPIQNTAEDVGILIKDMGRAVTTPFEKNSHK